MIGCIYNFRISFTINFIWDVLILFCTKVSEVISKCGLFKYYFAAFIVWRSTSLSFPSNAFFKVSVYWNSDYSCWAVTMAFIWATSPQGVIKDDNILGSLKIFWLSVMGSLGFLSSASPWANTHLTPIEHDPDVCQWRHNVVLYFWLKIGFIFICNLL